MDPSSLKTFTIRLGWALSSLLWLEVEYGDGLWRSVPTQLIHDAMCVQKDLRTNPNPNGP